MSTPLTLDPDAVAETLKPVERASMLPPRAFIDSGVFEWELENVFRGWVCAAHVSAVGEPGKFVMREIGDRQRRRDRRRGRAAARVPQRLPSSRRPHRERVRGQHSAAASSARTTAGPTGSTGSCKASPHMDGVEDFDGSCYGLIPVRLAVVGGLVLVDLGGDAPAADEQVGELVEHLHRYQVDTLARGGERFYSVDANWKALAENYSECLHCPGVHPELNRLSDYMSGEEVIGAGAWCGGSMTLREGAKTMGRGAGHASSRPPIAGLPESELDTVLYFVLFPNALVSLHPDYVMLHTLWPRSRRPHRGRVRVVLRARDDGPVRLRPERRDRLLGPGQPRGLARVRADAEGGRGCAALRPAGTRPNERDVHAFDVMVAERYMKALT